MVYNPRPSHSSGVFASRPRSGSSRKLQSSDVEVASRKPWPHSRKKLRLRIGDIVRHCVGKSCLALSSEPGLILLTTQVVRGSVGLDFVSLVVYPLAAPSEDRRRATFRRLDVR